jgi:hypothetical protein
MKAKINYTLPNGTEDYIIINGDTVEEIIKASEMELSKRGGSDPWSEVIEY